MHVIVLLPLHARWGGKRGGFEPGSIMAAKS